jgi:hypothetical protein
MRAHSDTLTRRDFQVDAPDEVAVDIVRTGSRARAHGFTFWLYRLTPGANGARRRNTGTRGGERSEFAATWDEHGELFARLFERDPRAMIGPYDGRADFHAKTQGAYSV